VARSQVTDKTEGLRVWRVAANILSLELVSPNWGLATAKQLSTVKY